MSDTEQLPVAEPLGIGNFDVGDEVLIPETMMHRARGGTGRRYSAARVEIKEFVEIDESSHRYSEGYDAE